jgi:hypothetical protein
MIRHSWRNWLPVSSRASAASTAPAGLRQPRVPDLPLKNGDLTAQDQNPGVLGLARAGEQGKPAEHARHHQVSESHRHEYRQCPTVRPPRSQTPSLTTPH